MEMISKCLIKGIDDNLRAEDLEKGFLQYVWFEVRTTKKIASGDLTEIAYKKAKSFVVFPKTAIGTSPLLELEQSVVGEGFKSEVYFKIKAIHKAV